MFVKGKIPLLDTHSSILYTALMPDSYQIGGGFTNAELGAANWWVRHHLQLRQAGYIFLILLSVVFWGYTLWSLLDAYVISYPRESRIPLVIQSNDRLRAGLTNNAPQAIQTSPIASFASTGDRRDFLTQITNPNSDWWAEFEYQFKLNGESTPARQGYILPNSQRYLAEIGWKGQQGAGDAELQVNSLKWHRLDPLSVERDYSAFAANRLQLQTTDPTYTNDLKVGEQTVGQTNFDLRNASGYGFWGVDLVVVLFRGGVPIAVTQLSQTELKPGEVRPISINWFDNVTGVDNTVVQPNVNILDPRVFLPPNRF